MSGLQRGEVANRILSVGSMDRAFIIADQLQGAEPGAPLFQHLSGRGFLTITGLYHGTPVSIITTLMGMPNMDFVVREARAVVDGQMAIVRLGTRDPDAWTFEDGRPYYTVSAPVPADPQLVQLLVAACNQHGGASGVVEGLDATADSFYSSQGRTGGLFEDVNEAVIEQLMAQHPQLVSLEMETFHLLDLARCSKGSIKAAAFCIAAAERYSNRFISTEQIHVCERLGGAAALTALTQCSLTGAVSADGSSSSSSNGNGKSHALPAGDYVWVQRHPMAAVVKSQA
ncbi:nucleoside phosphorylase domain-containing protein [Scenedesmus sp. NREL 46B-D3]|nr:nucleoside phosphorylase domain-containing protein [Scenedesmus sp. NREL 46B-D3]